MNKRRWMTLLALPLVLGVLLSAAKWKQMHPTATQRDLAERAHMREATIVDVVVGGRSLSLPVDAFKASLDDFYLLGASQSSTLPIGVIPRSAFVPPPTFIERQYTIRVRKNRRESPYLAEIYLSPNSSYVGKYLTKTGIEQHEARLHPATERRLREFLALYRDLK